MKHGTPEQTAARASDLFSGFGPIQTGPMPARRIRST